MTTFIGKTVNSLKAERLIYFDGYLSPVVEDLKKLVSTFNKTYTVSTDIDTHDITRLFSPYYKFIQIEEGGKYSITFLSNIESFILPKITLEIKNMKNREHLSVDPKLIEQKFIERAGSRKNISLLDLYIDEKFRKYSEYYFPNDYYRNRFGNEKMHIEVLLRIIACAYVRALITTDKHMPTVFYFIFKFYFEKDKVNDFYINLNSLEHIYVDNFQTFKVGIAYEINGLPDFSSIYSTLRNKYENYAKKGLEDRIRELFGF